MMGQQDLTTTWRALEGLVEVSARATGPTWLRATKNGPMLWGRCVCVCVGGGGGRGGLHGESENN